MAAPLSGKREPLDRDHPTGELWSRLYRGHPECRNGAVGVLILGMVCGINNTSVKLFLHAKCLCKQVHLQTVNNMVGIL